MSEPTDEEVQAWWEESLLAAKTIRTLTMGLTKGPQIGIAALLYAAITLALETRLPGKTPKNVREFLHNEVDNIVNECLSLKEADARHQAH